MICDMCTEGRHSHCRGLRFTAEGLAFKPDPQAACSCHDCDKLKEKWIWCGGCYANKIVPGEKRCANCKAAERPSSIWLGPG